MATLSSALDDLNIGARIADVRRGPTTRMYMLELGPKTLVREIERAARTIAVRLGYEELRILTPVPGTTYVGVEVPLPIGERVTVPPWNLDPDDPPLTVPIGEDSSGQGVTFDLAKAPHLLVAGSTGSGKSVWLNGALTTIVNRSLQRVKLTMIDPKQVELTPYEDVAHVVTDMEEAAQVVEDLVDVMEQRYGVMRDAGVRHAEELSLPYHLLVVDELADLIMQDKTVEKGLVRLAQKGRAARIHMILATQRPTKDVVTGLLKSNIPSRLAFSVTSTTDSMVILDQTGASALIGHGDGLFLPAGQRRPTRIQAPLTSTAEVDLAVEGAVRRMSGDTAKKRLDKPRQPRETTDNRRRRGRHVRMSETEREMQEYQ